MLSARASSPKFKLVSSVRLILVSDGKGMGFCIALPAMSSLTDSVAHELKSPLTSIRGRLKSALISEAPERVREQKLYSSELGKLFRQHIRR